MWTPVRLGHGIRNTTPLPLFRLDFSGWRLYIWYEYVIWIMIIIIWILFWLDWTCGILLGYIGVRLMTLVAVLYDDNNSEYVDNIGNNCNEYYIQHSYMQWYWKIINILLTVWLKTNRGSIQTLWGLPSAVGMIFILCLSSCFLNNLYHRPIMYTVIEYVSTCIRSLFIGKGDFRLRPSIKLS